MRFAAPAGRTGPPPLEMQDQRLLRNAGVKTEAVANSTSGSLRSPKCCESGNHGGRPTCNLVLLQRPFVRLAPATQQHGIFPGRTRAAAKDFYRTKLAQFRD